MGLVSLMSAAAAAGALAMPDAGDTGWLLATLLFTLITAVPGVLLLFAGAYGPGAILRGATATLFGGALAALLYAGIGYSLIYDAVTVTGFSSLLGGGQNAMLALMGTVRDGTAVPETAFVASQFGPILVALALLCAALAPRARSGWLLAFTGLWFLLVLVPVTRWLWGGGWLEAMGALDASGGLVVYAAAGSSALVAMAMVGSESYESAAVDPTRLLGGAGLLLIGAFAIGGGATLSAGDSAAVAVIATMLGGSAAMLTSALMRRSLDAVILGRGLVVGLVALACAGDAPSPGGAIAIGVLAALITALAARLVPKRLAWHDRGGLATTITVASVAGALLAAPFLSFEIFGGSGYAPGMGMVDQLVAQATASGAVLLWSAAGTAIAALMAGMVVPMRATDTPSKTGKSPA